MTYWNQVGKSMCWKSYNILLVVSLNLPAFAAPAVEKEHLNVLSWWGYFTQENLRPIEELCRVNLSVDEYYSNTEVLRRLTDGRTNYEFVVFSDTIYESALQHLETENVNIDLTEKTSSYQQNVARKFKKAKYSKNITYFQLALTGFLWQPENIEFEPTTALSKLFEKVGSKLVILIDDHVEGLHFFSKLTNKPLSTFPEQKALNEILANARLVIANDIHEAAKRNDFAFAYTWSGDAISVISDNPSSRLKFATHRDLSYVTVDLFYANPKSKAAKCVARAIASDSFLNKVASGHNYLSPYGPTAQKTETAKREIENLVFSKNNELKWIRSTSITDSEKLRTEWHNFKAILGFNR